MSLHLRLVTLAAAGIAALGVAALAASRSSVLRPALVGAIRGGLKAADWVGDRCAVARQEFSALAEEARRPAAPAKPAKAKG